MNLDNLRDVFHGQMKDIYSAEKQLVEAMPALMEAASNSELKALIKKHYEETQAQYDTVRQLLDDMDVNPGNAKCDAMEGLIKEAKDMASQKGDNDARDAGIICAAQKIEHYEIATYGSLRAWARILGETKVAETLDELLDQEYDADNAMGTIAEGWLNEEAM